MGSRSLQFIRERLGRMRVLVLMTETFGRHGGIAYYNRYLLRALCAHPDCSEVVAIPRVVSRAAEPLPAALTHINPRSNGKRSYITTVLKVARRHPEFDLIVCGHINLLPVAFMLRPWVRASIVLVVHGVEAWEPTSSPLVNHLARNVDSFISVSDYTKQQFLQWAKSCENRGFLLPSLVEPECFGPGPKNNAFVSRYGLAGKTV